MSRIPLLVSLTLVLLIGACDTVDPDRDLPRVPIEELMPDAADVTVDPTGRTPLAAVVSLETETPTAVSVRIEGERPVSREISTLDTVHTIDILGLYAGRTNTVTLRITDPERGYAIDTIRIQTDPLPETFPTIQVHRANTQMMEPGWNFSEISIAANGEWQTLASIFDHGGDIRWYMDLSFLGGLAFPVKRLRNGNILAVRGNDSYEVDMLGREINHWTTPGYWQHHEVVEKPDGNLIFAVNKGGLTTTDDHIIEIDRSSGAVVREWDMREIVDVYRRDFISDDTDWFHMNAIFYDAVDDALIISGRNQAVIKVTMENELVWILAPHKGWGRAGINQDGHETSEFLLTAVNADGNPYPESVQLGDEAAEDFDWVWGQHAPLVLPNGNLFVFDNGINRQFGAADSYSRGVEYEIDDEAMTVRQVWEYGSIRGEEFYSSIISDVDYLSQTGNRLIMPGTVDIPRHRALITEVTYPGKQVLFEASINFKDLNGTGQGWGQMDIVYRSERMPLYPEAIAVN